MELIEHWEFPVPSNCISTSVSLSYRQGDAIILFDYYDIDYDDKIFNGGLKFISTVAHRHSSEKFTKYVSGTYDKLVTIEDSNWVKELKSLSPEWAINQLNHYAIYLDSYGLYEFIAHEFYIIDIKEGALCEEL
ncbi:hypothetical protein C3943_13240 [Lysinibacillus sp. B2A1]|nr:hypothetical protein C3943_13240 [Lysinibacillus sp. B2A1]